MISFTATMVFIYNMYLTLQEKKMDLSTFKFSNISCFGLVAASYPIFGFSKAASPLVTMLIHLHHDMMTVAILVVLFVIAQIFVIILGYADLGEEEDDEKREVKYPSNL